MGLNTVVVVEAGYYVRNYIEQHGVLPNYVTVDGVKYSMPDLLAMMSLKIVDTYNGGKTEGFDYQTYGNPDGAFGDSINERIYKNEYYDMALRNLNYMNQYGNVPNYVTVPTGRMQYQTVVYAFARIMHWMYLNGDQQTLPEYVQ